MAYQSNIQRFSTIATDPLRNFRFQAQFSVAGDDPAFDKRITQFSGGFRSISGLTVNTQSLNYREGGFNSTVHHIPGMTTFDNILMERGVLWGNAQAMTWMRGLFAVTAGEGLNLGTGTRGNWGKNFRCNIKIYVMDHPNADQDKNIPRLGFLVRNAWPTSLRYSELNAEQGGLMMENITFVHEGLSVFYVDQNKKPVDSTIVLKGV